MSVQDESTDVVGGDSKGSPVNLDVEQKQYTDDKMDSHLPDQRKRLPRSQRKRIFRQERLAQQKLRRLQKRDNKRQHREQNEVSEDWPENDEKQYGDGDTHNIPSGLQGSQEPQHISKKQRIELIRERQKQALLVGQRIAIDCSLEKHMSPKECSKLAQQLCRLYGHNRKSEQPAHLYFTGLNKSGHLYNECVRKNSGFENYMVDMTEQHHSEVFSKDSIVCLSPDSPNVLNSIDKDKVYVIGGLVDEHVQKGKSASSAEARGIATAKLPLDEYMEKTESGTFKKVLTVNQVFGILLTYLETNDWKTVLKEWVPVRHGFQVKCDES